MKTSNLLVLAAMACLSGAALAAPVYEGFDYGTRTDLINASGGTGFDGGWSITGGSPEVTAGYQQASLSNGAFPFTTLGGAAVVNHNTSDMERTLAASQQLDLATDGVLYFSFLINVDESSTDNHLAFVHSGGELFVAGFRENGSGGLTARAVGGGGTQGTGGSFGLNTTYFVVGKVTASAAGNDLLALSVYAGDQTVPATEPAFSVVSTGKLLGGSLTGIRLSHGGTLNDGQSATFDEIRLAGTYAEVAVVPEPATGAAAAIGAAVCLLRVRRGL